MVGRLQLALKAAFSAAACACAITSPTLAVAQTFDIDVIAAWQRVSSVSELGQPEGLSAGLTALPLWGARGTAWLWRYVGVEAEAVAGVGTMTVSQGSALSTTSATWIGARGHLLGRLPLGPVELLGLAGGGVMRIAPGAASDAGTDVDPYGDVGLGASVALPWRLRLRADARAVVSGSTVVDQTFAIGGEFVLGIGWRFGSEAAPPVSDADGDGVPDAADRCPYERETVNGVRDSDGCPEHPEVAKRYHLTRFVRQKGQVVAPLPASGPRAPVSPPATKLPASASPTSDDGALEQLGDAVPLADDALPPLVSAGDDDGDGLARDDDVCPDDPEDVDGFEDADGCPDPDNDRDGVADGPDRCPMDAETINGVHDEDGCPEDPQVALRYHRTRYAATRDRGQTVAVLPERVRRLRQGVELADAATLSVLPEPVPLAPGALPPLVSAGDDDGDGLARDDDVCPDEAEDRDNFEDGDGCPEPDNDRDGVLDAADQCPTEAESRNGYRDDDGCPDDVPKPVSQRVGRIPGLRFAINSAEILPGSEAVLMRLVEVMVQFPELHVEISGHTDDRGARERNITLSQLRAESVRAWLVTKGADGQRIRAIGYGPDKPETSNATNAGRAQNRRVEFRLVSASGQDMTTPEQE